MSISDKFVQSCNLCKYIVIDIEKNTGKQNFVNQLLLTS